MLDLEELERWACYGCGAEFEYWPGLSHGVMSHHPDCRGSCERCPIEVECGPIERITDTREEPRE